MEVICINDTFSDEQRQKIPHLPVKDRIYTIRDVVRYIFEGRAGFLLEEIHNPEVDHPSGLGTFEPNFAVSRFRNIDGTVLTSVEILNWLRVSNLAA